MGFHSSFHLLHSRCNLPAVLRNSSCFPSKPTIFIKLNKHICLISAYKDMAFKVNRFLTGSSEPDFNYSRRTPIPDTIAGTHVQGKIIQNGTKSADHSDRLYLYMYPLINLKYCIPLIFVPCFLILIFLHENKNSHVLRKSLLVLWS